LSVAETTQMALRIFCLTPAMPALVTPIESVNRIDWSALTDNTLQTEANNRRSINIPRFRQRASQVRLNYERPFFESYCRGAS